MDQGRRRWGHIGWQRTNGRAAISATRHVAVTSCQLGDLVARVSAVAVQLDGRLGALPPLLLC